MDLEEMTIINPDRDDDDDDDSDVSGAAELDDLCPVCGRPLWQGQHDHPEYH